MNTLPNEISYAIFKRLDYKSLSRASATCTQWRDLAIIELERRRALLPIKWRNLFNDHIRIGGKHPFGIRQQMVLVALDRCPNACQLNHNKLLLLNHFEHLCVMSCVSCGMSNFDSPSTEHVYQIVRWYATRYGMQALKRLFWYRGTVDLRLLPVLGADLTTYAMCTVCSTEMCTCTQPSIVTTFNIDAKVPDLRYGFDVTSYLTYREMDTITRAVDSTKLDLYDTNLPPFFAMRS